MWIPVLAIGSSLGDSSVVLGIAASFSEGLVAAWDSAHVSAVLPRRPREDSLCKCM
jgi:hypothetical protein